MSLLPHHSFKWSWGRDKPTDLETQRRDASVLGRESPTITFLRAVPNAAGPFRSKTRQNVS